MFEASYWTKLVGSVNNPFSYICFFSFIHLPYTKINLTRSLNSFSLGKGRQVILSRIWDENPFRLPNKLQQKRTIWKLSSSWKNMRSYAPSFVWWILSSLLYLNCNLAGIFSWSRTFLYIEMFPSNICFEIVCSRMSKSQKKARRTLHKMDTLQAKFAKSKKMRLKIVYFPLTLNMHDSENLTEFCDFLRK